MSHENPQIPEGINYSKEHPLKEFAWLVVGISSLLIAAIIIISLSVERLAPYIPFKYELRVTESFNISSIDEQSNTQTDKTEQVEKYLSSIVQRLQKHIDLPEDMRFKIHYLDDAETINAFATLGGHIMIFEGLIKNLNSENALAMVIAHEMAHVIHRDPIVALGRGLTVSLVLTAITGSDNSAISQHMSRMGLLTMLAFNREQENNADTLALELLQKEYGHINGASEFFEFMHSQTEGRQQYDFAFLQSHPLTQERINKIQSWEQQEGELAPLPKWLTPTQGTAIK